MRITIAAVGRLKRGPEQALVEHYIGRFDALGRPLGLGPCTLAEVEDRKGGGKLAEAALLQARIPENAVRICLDERGKALTSPQFATRLADWRDDGRRDCCLLIGGADGLDPSLTAEADLLLSFGKMVWPHMLARVMLTEQLFRAAGILAGTPYHRV